MDNKAITDIIKANILYFGGIKVEVIGRVAEAIVINAMIFLIGR